METRLPTGRQADVYLPVLGQLDPPPQDAVGILWAVLHAVDVGHGETGLGPKTVSHLKQALAWPAGLAVHLGGSSGVCLQPSARPLDGWHVEALPVCAATPRDCFCVLRQASRLAEVLSAVIRASGDGTP